MKKLTLISIVSLVLGIILSIGGMALMGFDFAKLSTVKREMNSHEITQSFENLSIEVDTADIRFAKSTDDKCKIVCYEATNAKHTVSVVNGTLSIQNKCELKWYERIGINTDEEYVVLYLPATAYTSLNLVTDTGDVEMPSLFTFQNASVTTDTGDITWKATVANTLSLTVDTGDIEVENILVKTLVVESDTGDVECENVIASEKISIETDTGDVELNDCDGAELWIETDTGDVSGRLLTDKEYIYKTSTGKVRVPETDGGRCEITTSTGDIYFR